VIPDEQTQKIDIRTVEFDTLPDADDVSVNMDLPKQERMRDVVNQMGGNPYVFEAGKSQLKSAMRTQP